MTIPLGVFPTSAETFKGFYRFFELNKPIGFGLLSIFFMGRLALLLLSGSGSREYGDVFRDLLFSVLALVGFLTLLQIIQQFPSYLLNQLSWVNEVELKRPSVVQQLISGWWSDVIDIVAIAISVIVSIVYGVLVAFACMLGPIIIVFTFMGRQTWILKTLITFLIIVSLWPVFWTLINIFMHISIKESSVFQATAIIVIGNLAKVAIPIGVVKMLGQLSGTSSGLQGARDLREQAVLRTLQAAKMTGNLVSTLGGAPHMASLANKTSAVTNFAKEKGLGALGQVIPSIEKAGDAAIGGSLHATGWAGNKIAEHTPHKIKSPLRSVHAGASQVAHSTQNIMSKAANAFKGHNYEAYSLGSTIPSRPGWATKNGSSAFNKVKEFKSRGIGSSYPRAENGYSPQSPEPRLDQKTELNQQKSFLKQATKAKSASQNTTTIPSVQTLISKE